MAPGWLKSRHRLGTESGLALAVVLLILVVLLLMGSTLIGLSTTENLAGANVAHTKIAFHAAETGVQEAMYRMRLDPATLSDEGDTTYSATADPVVIGKQGTPDTSWADPTSPNFWHYNPSWSYSAGGGYGGSTVYGNFLGGAAGNLDSAGRTFTSSGSSHAGSGSLVNANLANGASYTVTVAPVVGFVGGCWQYVDQLGTPLGSCTAVASNPLFKVTATGTAGSAQKRLSTMIRRFNVKPPVDGTITANTYVNVQSASAIIDGHNFDCNGNTPSDTDSVKAVTVPSGYTVSVNKPQNLQCTAGTGVSNCAGTAPPFPSTIGALLLGAGAKPEEIDALNAYLESKKIPPAQAPTAAFDDIVYIDGNYTQPPDGSKGILIVHNASTTANLGNFNTGTFKGLIIADQVNQINGSIQIIGGVIARAPSATVTLNDLAGTPSVKYSKCQIAKLSRYFPYEVVRGTWHEK